MAGRVGFDFHVHAVASLNLGDLVGCKKRIELNSRVIAGPSTTRRAGTRVDTRAATALVVSQPQTAATNLAAQNAVFLHQTVDHLILMAIDPAGEQ